MKSPFFYIIIMFLLATAACSKKEKEQDRDTFEYFKTRLDGGMKYDNIVSIFGWPDGDIGSGIHIYVYRLSDGTSILIGYADKIIYVVHVDGNRQLLHTII